MSSGGGSNWDSRALRDGKAHGLPAAAMSSPDDTHSISMSPQRVSPSSPFPFRALTISTHPQVSDLSEIWIWLLSFDFLHLQHPLTFKVLFSLNGGPNIGSRETGAD